LSPGKGETRKKDRSRSPVRPSANDQSSSSSDTKAVTTTTPSPSSGGKPTKAQITKAQILIGYTQKIEKKKQKMKKREMNDFIGKIVKKLFVPSFVSSKLEMNSEMEFKSIFDVRLKHTFQMEFELVELTRDQTAKFVDVACTDNWVPDSWADTKWLQKHAHTNGVCCQIGFTGGLVEKTPPDTYHLEIKIGTMIRPHECRCESLQT
jgi:hypothetical protein